MKMKAKSLKREKEIVKPYKLAHQILSLTGINFTRQTVIGFTELTLIPTKDSFRYIWINCKQACIYKVTLNDTLEVPFQYFDPLLEICLTDSKLRNLSFLNKNQINSVISVDPEYSRGEIIINISSEAQHLIQEGKALRVGIEFSLEKPQSGLHFVIPSGEGSLAERSAHMFSYGHENSTRLWFPCIDAYNEVCTWRLEFTVEESMVAVSCGELLEIVYTTDMRRKTYHYVLNIPTAAPNIGLAVGPFKIHMDPFMNEITHFCLPELLPVLKATSKHLHQAFEFFEELLSTRYPYSCYKQVYVDEAYKDLQSYSTMSIVSVNLLCSTRIIDQVYITRKALVLSVAQQFFSCFISRFSWSDAWLTCGISRYLMGLYVKKFFGFNEYKDWIHSELKEVIEYEEKFGGITLDPSSSPSDLNTASHHSGDSPSQGGDSGKDKFYFSVKSPHACSPQYIEMYYKKAHLVIRMLEFKIGNELMMQVLNKHMSLGLIASEHKGHPSGWNHMVISTATFTKTIFTVTGKDITVFCDQWVREAGHAKFKMKFLFNRKRNIVEMTIEQTAIDELGIKRYVGPLVVWLQELDGTFKHTLQIEHIVAKKEIVCHSKSRRNKKKKIPLCTGEEVDMDLSHLDVDSPVLWLRLDPDMTMMRSVDVEQPDNQWQYQLRHERDVTAQTDAIYALDKLARMGAVTTEMRNTLNAIIENEQCYYKVRCRAAHCLTRVANATVATWNGPPAMMQIFRKIFGSHTCPNIIKLLDFSNFQNYFLLKTLPVAMAGLRNVHKQCQPEVLAFLLDLFKYSDNSKNQFSDNYYRAALVDALSASISPALVNQDPATITPDSLPEDIKKILGEITRSLNLEKLLPCYKHTVTCACLRGIRTLQKNGYLPPKSDIFKSYTAYPLFIDVRLSAVDQLVDFLPVDGSFDDLNFLLNLIECDPVPYFRYQVIRRLALNPPFQMGQTHRLDTEELVDRLWYLMNSGQAYDSRIRCGAMDLYFALYGRRRPACVPPANQDSMAVSSAGPSNIEKKFNISSIADTYVREPSPPMQSPLVPHGRSYNPGPPSVMTTAPTTLAENTHPSFVSSATSDALNIPEENIHNISIKQEIPETYEETPMDFEDSSSRLYSEDLPVSTHDVPLPLPPHHHHHHQQQPPLEHVRIKDEVEVYDEMIRPLDGGEENIPRPYHEPHNETTTMDIEMSTSNPSILEETGNAPPVSHLTPTSFHHPGIFDDHSPEVSTPTFAPSLDSTSAYGTTPLTNVVPDDGDSTTGTDAGFSIADSQSNPPPDTPGINKHKLKKKRKDKKHKKHKKHEHNLDKFAPEENLSSGSSNPPSPASSHALSAPNTPKPL
ncbi:UNVERIFIED_CONTAM: hypothetical protein RMT77_007977 [Armadillidium vulgare]